MPKFNSFRLNNTIYAAFCQDNETVIIPDGISTITRGALYIGKTETPEITSVELPASIDSLETYSIIGEFIKSIKIKAATPPKCGENAIFPLSIIDNATVYVSDHDSAILDRYKSDPYWSNFNIVATNLSDTDNLPTDVNKDSFVNATDVVCIYNFIINGENSGISKQNADVNHDDSVDATDVVTVYNHIIMGSTNP